jgi:predicted nucleic acid-binding protein
MMVADASVWINLAATGQAHKILGAIEQRLAITEIALAELERGRPKGRRAADEVVALVHLGLVEVLALQRGDEALFLSLVSGAAAETLDDGEAATLACAEGLRACAVIDERKATLIAARRLKQLEVRTTTDLLLSAEVRAALGDAGLADALLNALTLARMRPPDHHVSQVVELVGEERASNCPSLPARLRIALSSV